MHTHIYAQYFMSDVSFTCQLFSTYGKWGSSVHQSVKSAPKAEYFKHSLVSNDKIAKISTNYYISI